MTEVRASFPFHRAPFSVSSLPPCPRETPSTETLFLLFLFKPDHKCVFSLRVWTLLPSFIPPVESSLVSEDLSWGIRGSRISNCLPTPPARTVSVVISGSTFGRFCQPRVV